MIQAPITLLKNVAGIRITKNVKTPNNKASFIAGKDIDKYSHLKWENNPTNKTPKIVFPAVKNQLNATWDEVGGCYTNNVYVVEGGDKYLLALLNSKTISYFLTVSAKDSKISFLKNVENIPIVLPSESQRQIVEKLVDYVLWLKTNKSCLIQLHEQILPLFFEQLIDVVVYELYFPNSVQTQSKDVLKFLQTLESVYKSDNPIKMMGAVYSELSTKTHPVASAMYYIDSVPEVRIILGK